MRHFLSTFNDSQTSKFTFSLFNAVRTQKSFHILPKFPPTLSKLTFITRSLSIFIIPYQIRFFRQLNISQCSTFIATGRKKERGKNEINLDLWTADASWNCKCTRCDARVLCCANKETSDK